MNDRQRAELRRRFEKEPHSLDRELGMMRGFLGVLRDNAIDRGMPATQADECVAKMRNAWRALLGIQ